MPNMDIPSPLDLIKWEAHKAHNTLMEDLTITGASHVFNDSKVRQCYIESYEEKWSEAGWELKYGNGNGLRVYPKSEAK